MTGWRPQQAGIIALADPELPCASPEGATGVGTNRDDSMIHSGPHLLMLASIPGTAGPRQLPLPVHLLCQPPLLGCMSPVAEDVRLEYDGVVHVIIQERQHSGTSADGDRTLFPHGFRGSNREDPSGARGPTSHPCQQACSASAKGWWPGDLRRDQCEDRPGVVIQEL